MASALALVHQGIEFLLKAHIAEQSPFLLLAGGPRDWPSGSDTRDVSFAEFRIIDAQDLVRAYHTVVLARLPATFLKNYEALRRRRNTIMHSFDPTLDLAAHELLVTAVDAVNVLSPTKWTTQRREYLKNTPTATAYSTDHVHTILIRECMFLLELLRPEQVREYLGFDKRQRRYVCSFCHAEDVFHSDGPNSAVLTPNLPSASTVHCFICDETQNVARIPCPNPDCPGNVIGIDSITGERTCLTCSFELGVDEEHSE